MKHCKQDEELTNTSPRPFPSKEPNLVTLQAIHEGDASLVTGKSGRFDNGADLIDAALKAPEMLFVAYFRTRRALEASIELKLGSKHPLTI